MDADGAIAYLGRADDLMNAGGFRVSPLEVEAALARPPRRRRGRRRRACRSAPGVAVIAAFYVPRGRAGGDEAELARHCAARLARYKCPRPSAPSRRCPAAQRQADAPHAQGGVPVTTRLDIISDPVCPWCYLGAASLMRALGEHAGPHPLALHWRPYQLDPSLPPEGVDRAA